MINIEPKPRKTSKYQKNTNEVTQDKYQDKVFKKRRFRTGAIMHRAVA